MTCNHQWIQEIEGTTIRGGHIHVYRCSGCGLLDLGEEGEPSHEGLRGE